MKRIAIVGVPGSGKTTYATKLSVQYALPVMHTDDLRGDSWSLQGTHTAQLLNQPGGWIIEGVTVARGLRKWLKANPAPNKPVETAVIMRTPYSQQSKGRARLGKGVLTVLEEILPDLRRRGVKLIEKG